MWQVSLTTPQALCASGQHFIQYSLPRQNQFFLQKEVAPRGTVSSSFASVTPAFHFKSNMLVWGYTWAETYLELCPGQLMA